MSEQIKTIYKISQIFGAAFTQINQVCAHYLADKSIQKNSDNIKKEQKKKDPPQTYSTQKQEQKKNFNDLISKVQLSLPKSQKAQTEKKSTPEAKAKQPTNPDKPKQPLGAFFLFQADQKQNFKKAHPEFSLTQLSAVMGQIWNSLDDQEKQPYLKKQSQLKEAYEKKLKKYYQLHPEEKSKKQLKRQKQEMKNEKISGQKQEKKAVQSPKLSSKDLSKKHVILVQEEEQSD